MRTAPLSCRPLHCNACGSVFARKNQGKGRKGPGSPAARRVRRAVAPLRPSAPPPGKPGSYPSFLEGVPFDPNDVDRVCQTEAGGHAYRGITFPLEEAERTYLQVLVNVDAELAILDGFTRTLVLYLAAVVVAAAAASYLLSRRTLKPIVQNWKAQTEFVQNASHELRTPLAVVQATGELLLDHPESRIVDRFEDVNVITEETKRLARLVDSLMELSLDDAGRAQPNRPAGKSRRSHSHPSTP